LDLSGQQRAQGCRASARKAAGKRAQGCRARLYAMVQKYAETMVKLDNNAVF
jgi:hypothetical protein